MTFETNIALNPRRESILKTLIETYYEAKEPVGSRLIAERHKESLSSATIRMVLSDLELELMLEQPHTSSGRVPTEKAYRYYVNRWNEELSTHRLPLDHQRALSATTEMQNDDLESWVQHASRTLSEMMGGVCLALPTAHPVRALAKLEFIPLGPTRIVAIWVDADGKVEHRVFENQWTLTPEQLQELGNFSTQHFSGLTLVEMQNAIIALMRRGVNEVQRLVSQLHQISEHWASSPTSDKVTIQGLNRLTKLPEFRDIHHFNNIVEKFEEHKQLVQLLKVFTKDSIEKTQVVLGTENDLFAHLSMATMVRTIPLGQGSYVTFAMVGPLRMNYPLVLGGLKWWAHQIQARRNSTND